MKWRAVNYALVIDDETGKDVAHTFDGAQALLIASAPSLLAACKAARAALMAFPEADGSKVAAQLDAAINAAEKGTL